MKKPYQDDQPSDRDVPNENDDTEYKNARVEDPTQKSDTLLNTAAIKSDEDDEDNDDSSNTADEENPPPANANTQLIPTDGTLTFKQAGKELLVAASPFSIDLGVMAAASFIASIFMSHYGDNETEMQNYNAASGAINGSMSLLIGMPASSTVITGMLIKQLKCSDSEIEHHTHQLVRAMTIHGLVISGIALGMCFSLRSIFNLLDQPEESSRLAQQFFVAASGHIIFFTALKIPQQVVFVVKNISATPNQNFWQKIKNYSPMHYSYFFNAATIILFGGVFMYGKNPTTSGVIGLGLGYSLSSLISFLTLMLHIKTKPHWKNNVFPFLTLQKIDCKILYMTFKNSFFAAGVSTADALISWSVTLLSGKLGTQALRAQQLVNPFIFFIIIPPIGLQICTAIAIGQRYRNNKIIDSKQLARTGLFLEACYTLSLGLLLVAIPEVIMSMFINIDAPENLAVVAQAKPLFRINAATFCFNGLRIEGIGIVRGLGAHFLPLIANSLTFASTTLFAYKLRESSDDMSTALQGVFIGQLLGSILGATFTLGCAWYLSAKNNCLSKAYQRCSSSFWNWIKKKPVSAAAELSTMPSSINDLRHS